MLAPSVSGRSSIPQTCAEGVGLVQSAWIYDELGYARAAVSMYERAASNLAELIDNDELVKNDAFQFHLGWSRLRLCCLHLLRFDISVGRRWLNDALPPLQAAWTNRPTHPVYQKALIQVALLLGRIDFAEQVRIQSPDSSARQTIDDWVFRALQIFDRFRTDGDLVLLDETWVDPRWSNPGDPPVPENWALLLLEEIFGSEVPSKSSTIF